MRRFLMAMLALLAAAVALAGVSVGATSADATTANRTVTFVNRTGQPIWIGSGVNNDGSKNLTGLPRLNDSQRATITVPESGNPGHWRGRFFARQGCTGKSGSTFHCVVGDCGKLADRCTTGAQPTSLAEFNFDRHNKTAPWYNVSYVDAVSFSITIEPTGAKRPPGSNQCETQGCSDRLLQYCPPANLTKRGGKAILCTNPNRDAKTSYSNAISSHCPRAYAWSKQDTEPGNKTMRNCPSCRGFVVTFHRGI
ncbi:thaumatin family protein [Amycolatopsis jejuensis]|uniref:thaumatin family protein n=1 Tax=Amycolatopsis jejuensis TaxID=330084 RepID=UPI000525AB88|nr:thaumatin family protein [Amycolatopsis jejuensis]